MNIFIGNLSYNVIGGDLRHAFEAHGEVTSATVIRDEESGKSKGFGFVEMPNQFQAQSAISALNGSPFFGRTITVNEARFEERQSRDGINNPDRRGRGCY
jgi:RNA recognition motif-containing protein